MGADVRRCETALDLLALRSSESEAEVVNTMTGQIRGTNLIADVTGDCFYPERLFSDTAQPAAHRSAGYGCIRCRSYR